MTFKVGQVIQYTSYGVEKTGTITRIGRDGKILFLKGKGGQWLFAESVTAIVKDKDNG